MASIASSRHSPQFAGSCCKARGSRCCTPSSSRCVALAKAAHPAVEVSTITNGSLLSAERVDRLVELGLQRVAVSIESGDPGVFREIRGGSFEEVIEGVRTLLAARNRRGAGRPAVGFAVTVLRRTLGQLPAIVSLYETLGLDGGLTIQPLQPMPAYTRYYGEAMQSQVLSPRDVAELAGRISGDPRTRQVVARAEAMSREFLEAGAGGLPPGQCYWLTRGLYVAADGMALACCFQKDAARDGFGIVGQAPVEEILSRRQRWAEDIERGVLPEGCRGCFMASMLAHASGFRGPSRRDPPSAVLTPARRSEDAVSPHGRAEGPVAWPYVPVPSATDRSDPSDWSVALAIHREDVEWTDTSSWGWGPGSAGRRSWRRSWASSPVAA